MKNKISLSRCGIRSLLKFAGLIACMAVFCSACATSDQNTSEEEIEAAYALPGKYPISEDNLEQEAAYAREQALKCQQEIDQKEADLTITMVESMANVMKSREHKDPKVREQAAEDLDSLGTIIYATGVRKNRVIAERDSWLQRLDKIKELREQQNKSGGGGGGGGC